MTLDLEYPVDALYLKQLHEESKAELEQLTRRAQQDGLRFEMRQVPGDPICCIIDMADAEKAVLIVMGTHGRTGLDRALGQYRGKRGPPGARSGHGGTRQ